MSNPLLLAAISFFAIIIVGSVLVALNDWLESRAAVEAASGSGSQRRARPASVGMVGRAGFASGRSRDSMEIFAKTVGTVNPVTSRSVNRNAGRKVHPLGWRA